MWRRKSLPPQGTRLPRQTIRMCRARPAWTAPAWFACGHCRQMIPPDQTLFMHCDLSYCSSICRRKGPVMLTSFTAGVETEAEGDSSPDGLAAEVDSVGSESHDVPMPSMVTATGGWASRSSAVGKAATSELPRCDSARTLARSSTVGRTGTSELTRCDSNLAEALAEDFSSSSSAGSCLVAPI
uniref:FLZ-type domain-containing protein n=1 Tax=Alexandrium monilatum TaxID=311494 RepID=A0A7S4R8F7_9DINO